MSNSQTKNFNSVPNPSCSNYLNILTCQRLFPIWPCHENLLRLHTEKIANDILSKQLNLNHHILCNIQLYLLRVLHVGNHNTKTNIRYSMHNKCILCVIHNYCISSMWATIMLGCASLHPTTLHQYHQSYNLKVLFTFTVTNYLTNQHFDTCNKGTTIPWQTASAPMLLYPNPPLHIPHNIRSQCSDCSLMWYLHISHLSSMWTQYDFEPYPDEMS